MGNLDADVSFAPVLASVALVPGDLVVLGAGDALPADGGGSDLRVSASEVAG